MAKNYLLIYSEQLATDMELLCQNIKSPSNTLFQIRKSSSSVYANIREANYGQSKADMLSKFEIALKECSETEGWLQLLFNTSGIDEETYKNYRNLCGRIRRMLIASCKTLKENIKWSFTDAYLSLPYETDANKFALEECEKLCPEQKCALQKLYEMFLPRKQVAFAQLQKIFDEIDKLTAKKQCVKGKFSLAVIKLTFWALPCLR